MMDSKTLTYLIAFIVLAHFLIAIVWLMIKLTKKK